MEQTWNERGTNMEQRGTNVKRTWNERGTNAERTTQLNINQEFGFNFPM